MQTDFYKSAETLIQSHISIPSVVNEMTSYITVIALSVPRFRFRGEAFWADIIQKSSDEPHMYI